MQRRRCALSFIKFYESNSLYFSEELIFSNLFTIFANALTYVLVCSNNELIFDNKYKLMV